MSNSKPKSAQGGLSIVRATLTQQVCTTLKSKILYGELPSGSRIWADELAADMGVSIAPVKEAFLILAGEGLIKNIPRRGSVIRQFTAQEMHDLYDLRKLLELRALEQMFEADRVTEAFVEELRSINKAICDLDDEGDFKDRKTAFDLDWAFHQCFVENCGHDMVVELYGRLNTQSQIVRYSSWNIGPRCQQTIDEHRALVLALEAGDQEAARQAIIDHLGSIRDDFEKALPAELDEDESSREKSRGRRQTGAKR